MRTKSSTPEDRKRFRVVIFGSARIEKGDANWNLIYHLAKRIAQEGIDIVTGGGPGLMNAASEGHYAGDISKNVNSIGLQIILPKKQRNAEHLDIMKEFSRFSERLDNFIELANVVVVAPGGIGTLLEFLYTWQLMQVKMISHIPIILLGEIWQEFFKWVKKELLENHFIDQGDVELLVLVKGNEEALNIIKKTHEKFDAQQ